MPAEGVVFEPGMLFERLPVCFEAWITCCEIEVDTVKGCG